MVDFSDFNIVPKRLLGLGGYTSHLAILRETKVSAKKKDHLGNCLDNLDKMLFHASPKGAEKESVPNATSTHAPPVFGSDSTRPKNLHSKFRSDRIICPLFTR